MSKFQRRHFLRDGSGLSILALAALLMLGCPVPQVPRVPDENANANAPVGGTSTNTNSFADGPVRPVPGVPVVVDQPPGADDAGDVPISDAPTSSPLAVAITNFENSLNILPGQSAALAFQVLGGRALDGPVAVTIFVDSDGVDHSGDERTLLDNQPLRGQVELLTSSLPAGRYFVGVRARNIAGTSTRYALGRLEIVGAATLSVAAPSTSRRTRPTSVVDVRATISTLAQTVSWRVFTDIDTEFNGNEVFAFSGGGATVQGGIVLQSLPQGSYFIGVEITDSLQQRFVRYLGPQGCEGAALCHSIQIDAAPTVELLEPTAAVQIQPGAQTVRVVARVSDAESNAVVTLFRDSDSTINDNEFVLATFQLSSPSSEFETTFSTAGLFPGTYRFGAKADDGAGPSVGAYAAGPLVILEPPTVTGQFDFVYPFGRRPNNANQPLEVQFTVSDQFRRLAFQPEGIRLNLYLDADTDGVPDSTTPLLSTTSDQLNRPFKVGANSFMLNLASLALPSADPDGLIDVLGELVLRENGGNVVPILSPDRVARQDAVPPDVTPMEPSLDQTLSRADGMLTVRFLSLDNDFTFALTSLVRIFDPMGPPPLAAEVNISAEFLLVLPGVPVTAAYAIPAVTPVGDYFVRITIFDTTDEVTEVDIDTVTITITD